MAQHGLENRITCIKVTLNAPLCVFHMLYGLSEIKVLVSELGPDFLPFVTSRGD